MNQTGRSAHKLLSKGAEPDWQHPVGGWTALHLAAGSGQARRQHLMRLASRNNNNAQTMITHHALMNGCVCVCTQAEVVMWLINNGASASAEDEFGKLPEHYAFDSGHDQPVST